MLDELVAAMTMLGCHTPLSNLRFFDPKPVFVQWMRQNFDGYHIYDVGAGVGHVSRMLDEAGFDVTALDILTREDPEFPILRASGSSFPYEEGSVVMLARPCHGIFPESVLQHVARNCKVVAVVYVGLTKNVNDDLGDFRKRFKMAKRNVGFNKENIYVWRS